MKQRRESSNGSSRVPLSDERLRQITREQGKAVAQAHREQADQVLRAAGILEQIRAKPEQGVHLPQPVPPEWLQVGCAGGWVPSCEQTGGLEGKIAVLASQREAVGKRGRQ